MNFNATLIIQVVSFLILFALLVKFLYRPFLDFMDKRSNKVKKWLDEAYDNREQAEERIKESERHLKEAKDQILKLRKQAEIQADEHRQGILKDAKEEADRIAEI
jgi:F-type H+-transporting ATPase subunit b